MSSLRTDTSIPGPSEKTGRWVLFASVLAASIVFIDGTALNVALPSLQADLGASGRDLFWINNAYALILAALLLLGGALGDRFGRKRIYMTGICLFAGASLGCGLAPTPMLLIAARAGQGVGGALMIPGSLAIIADAFGAQQRGRAIGTWSAFTVIASAVGPVLGGLLADGHLPTEARIVLAAEAAKLGEAKAPAGLIETTRQAVEHQIKLAFVDVFRLVAGVAAGLSWLSALAALCLMEGRNPNAT